ncbi:MAG: SURF1 family protein [Burkholderiaceae bacterium]|nr:SURF1 family protein [Microbacteriaceae bacterium]
MWGVARRPRWIAALVLAIVIAGLFAALGQWQLARSIESGVVIDRATESTVPLTEVAEPQSQLTLRASGQLVEATGRYVPEDTVVLSNRLSEGTLGYWVVGHLVLENPQASLAVALGWVSEADDAAAVTAALPSGEVTVTGRYLPTEAPQDTDFENGVTSTLATASLVNVWTGFDGDVYSGYVVSEAPIGDARVIDAPAPSEAVSLNWLNIFYAAEWVVFAGFAIFMWYRLVRDAWERETELAADAKAAEVN